MSFNRRPAYEYLLSSPLTALLYPIHHALLRLRGPPRLLPLPATKSRPIRVVCISDTHCQPYPGHVAIPDGDLLIHAGDLCNDGSLHEIQAAVDWLQSLPHAQKVVICGNHDSYFDVRSRRDEDRESAAADTGLVSSSSASIRSLDDLDSHRVDWGDIHYLQHSSVTLSFTSSPGTTPESTASANANARTLTLYGAPQIPALVPFGPEHAFVYSPQHNAWAGTVPPDTDILITHTPPFAHRDLSPGFSMGCPQLLAESWRVRPALHVCGHVHEGYGAEPVFWDVAQRAWERLCAVRRRRIHPAAPAWRRCLAGPWRDLVDVAGWLDALRVVVYGVLGVVWAKVWGGENLGSGWVVNAAQMVGNTGRLGNAPIVIDL